MFARQCVYGCKRILSYGSEFGFSRSSASAVRYLTRCAVPRTVSVPVAQRYFSTESAAKPSGEEIRKKMKEATAKVQAERAKEATKANAAGEKKEPEAKVVKKEECFTTVKDATGNEVTIQTKAVDAAGKPPVEEKVVKLVDEVLALNFIQIGQFMRVMKERLGLPDVLAAPSAAPAVGAPGAPGAPGAADAAAGAGEKKEEKKEKRTASVKLVKYDAKDKIKIIKEVRGLLNLGLKESKTLVESVPVMLKENMPKKEAEELAAKLKALGAETAFE
ncbi:Ribosomal protein L7/L12 [Blastocystis hominis]|uniref:Ribosomal protein L7/L12 n=1 Tax=Blastocystis hominis TaxID=12968 RepID=D8M918_BLAHO|nr:Ribosomal protein L7/L12 [Blastocystis hominis]CBK24557.2 Ribosomal protein L7/L12 [Blastocystis hominis]|eukprot:XP_012898605.1 Ribosomal protein L7/L12 [Blastocystis hominis]